MSKELLAAGKRVRLGRTEKAILMAFCEHFRAPDAPRMWAIPSIAETVCVDPRTVQRHLRPDARLIRDGYLTRHDSRRPDGQHNAPSFSVVNPQKWPATPTATRAGGDRLSPVTERHQGVVTARHPNPVLNTPLGVTDVTPLSPVGDEAAVSVPEEKPKADVICLESRRTGLTLGIVIGLYNRYCCAQPGEAKTPQHMTRCTLPTDKLRKAVSARVREDVRRRDPQWWGVYFRAAAANDLLNGNAGRRDKAAGRDRAWTKGADLRWLLGQENMAKFAGGSYEDCQQDFDAERDPSDDPSLPAAPEARHVVH